MRKILALLPLMVFVMIISANAQTPRVDERQQNQHQRIQQGIASGELTRRETVRSVRDQRRIRRAEHVAKADGNVTNAERARLHHMQNTASRQLSRNKHDAQDRPRAN